ncbi:hypothetical protein [Chamaesiphon polymorphus]|uniref:Uncharacterized protein n=1 Tax=Chamaesiphon polymorphus CCALA 037 TaxID=2107692 RepID=A0A2T1GB69_9CYAN|nr:hypothetical protein [Chamaesiphon polymorphus]PSB54559.1 hypothetical protein C7B77_17780 [Chamaesiphon polymorphus CCALA 037]
MARPIEQVEQDLTQLRKASSQLGEQLTGAYQSYFTSLASTLKKQSIQGCYYLCTTCYPEAFLKLNYDRRSQLLTTLKRVIRNVITDLVVHIEPNRPKNRPNDEDEPTGELTSMPVMPMDWFATPASLATWQQNIEAEIGHSLKEISYKVNLLLQQAQIMPPTIPKQILEATDEADRQGGSTANVPNVLSILIERETTGGQGAADDADDRAIMPMTMVLDREDELSQIVQIHSLYLRLTEVEFADVTTLSLRKNISQLSNKVNTLRREYVQKQQELKIAEAESAWRNSWFED